MNKAVFSNNTWLYSPYGERLHFIAELGEVTDFWDVADDYCGVNAKAACGRSAHWQMPGLFSRLGLPRCRKCCKAAGIPCGDGAPYNYREDILAEVK